LAEGQGHETEPRGPASKNAQGSFWRALAKISAADPRSRYARMTRRNPISRKRWRWLTKIISKFYCARLSEIAEHWSQVEAVATALLERERLEALEIYRIVLKFR
jgi:hypothetical protein